MNSPDQPGTRGGCAWVVVLASGRFKVPLGKSQGPVGGNGAHRKIPGSRLAPAHVDRAADTGSALEVRYARVLDRVSGKRRRNVHRESRPENEKRAPDEKSFDAYSSPRGDACNH
jgi:hypothetical protein